MSEDEDDLTFLSLEKLPTEIILYIFNLLDARFVADVLGLVCQRFSDLLIDNVVWKSRMKEKWTEKYLTLPGTEVSWKDACIDREEQHHLWSNYKAATTCHTLQDIHLANIDSFKMLRDSSLLAAASRDRSFSIWNLEKLNDESEVLVHHHQNAHEGWIWCILGSDDKFFTGSWDSTIKSWDSNSFTNLSTIKCESNILCLAQHQWALFAGLYRRKIMYLDLRESLDQNIRTFTFHKRSVLDLAMIDDNQLASVSEDCNLNIIDWRMENVLFTHKFDEFPSCLSYQNNQLWIGDKGGNVHLINAKTHEFIMTGSNIHEKLITGIKNSLGSVTTSSKDGSICILEPTLRVKEITRISNDYKMELTGFEWYNNMLISSMKSGSDITIWSPKSE